MIILDPWSARRLVGGVVAYHDAKSRNEDAEKAFWEFSGMRFASATDYKQRVPQILLDYPDLAVAALAVLDLDHEYRSRNFTHGITTVSPRGKITQTEGWTPEQIEEWKDKRRVAVDRLDMLRHMIDHEAKGFDFVSPLDGS